MGRPQRDQGWREASNGRSTVTKKDARTRCQSHRLGVKARARSSALVSLVVVPVLLITPALSASAAQPLSAPNYLSALDVENASLLFAVGDRSISRTSDGGESWQTVSVPLPAIAGAAFLDRSTWFVAAASVGRAGLRVPIISTNTSGNSWRRVLLSRPYPDGHGAVQFAFANRRDGWLTVDTVHGSAFADVDLYRTHDGGASWHYVSVDSFSGPISFAMGRLWAPTGATSSNLATSADGGRTWRSVSLPVPDRLKGQAVTVGLPRAIGGDQLALATKYTRSGGVRDVNTVVIYVGDDRGRYWRATAPLTDRLFSDYGGGVLIPTTFVDSEHWFVAGGDALYRSDNGGRAWRRVNADAARSGLGGLIGLSAIDFPIARLGFGLIEYGSCQAFKRGCAQRSFVVRSNDGGQRWSLLGLDPAASAAPLCKPNQLAARAGFGGVTGSAVGGVGLRNTSARTCSLSRRPLVAIVWRGRALAVEQSRPLGRMMFPQVPVRVLPPRRQAFVSLQWFNWCGMRANGPARLTVELRLGRNAPAVRAVADGAVIPRCDALHVHSTLWVGDFVEPPS